MVPCAKGRYPAGGAEIVKAKNEATFRINKYQMRKFWTWIVVAFVTIFAGCYEINEEITINDNGSGTYITKMDMSALIQMMQSMASEEEIAKSGLNRAIDTVINLKSIMDTAKDVSPEQRRLFQDGAMKMKVDLEKSIFTADVRFPFKSLNDLQLLMSGSGSGGLSEVFKQVFVKKDSAQGASLNGRAGPRPDQQRV